LAIVCPITKLDFKTKEELSTQDLTGYTTVPFDENISIVYSKNSDSLPITTIRLEYEPCMDSFV